MDLLLTIGYLLIFLFALGFFAGIHRRFWAAYYKLETAEDEIHFVECDDGGRVALFRYVAPAGSKTTRPIICCHGIAANRFNLDLKPGRSLVRYLNSLGFDVWNVELRGFGQHSRPDFLSGRSWSIQFEDYVDQDMPAIIRHVLLHTEADRVHWVGHSMGGLIAYAFAQGPGAPLLASITTIGTPARVRVGGLLTFLASLYGLVGWLPLLPLRWISQFGAPLTLRLPLPAVAIDFENVETDTVRQSMVNIVQDIPGPLMRQFARWALTGEAVTNDGRNFTTGLSSVTVPVLAISGANDMLAPPAATRFGVESVSSEKRAYINLGGEGAGVDAPAYGHGDLLFGRHAAREVYGRIAAWVCEVDGIALDELVDAAAHEAELSLPPSLETRDEQASELRPPPIMPATPREGGRVESGEIAEAILRQGRRSLGAARQVVGRLQGKPSEAPTQEPGTLFPDASEDDLEAAPLAGYDDMRELTSHSSLPAVEAPDTVDYGEVDDEPPTEVEEAEDEPEMPPEVVEEPEARPLPSLGDEGDAPPERVPANRPRSITRQTGEVSVKLERRARAMRSRRRLRRVEELPRAELSREGRRRPTRLHRSPVSGDALTEALRIAATRASDVLGSDGDDVELDEAEVVAEVGNPGIKQS